MSWISATLRFLKRAEWLFFLISFGLFVFMTLNGSAAQTFPWVGEIYKASSKLHYFAFACILLVLLAAFILATLRVSEGVRWLISRIWNEFQKIIDKD